MEEKSEKFRPKAMGIFESVFDVCYLLFDLAAGILFLKNADGRLVFELYGALALVLGGGDAFHLVPRIKVNLFGKSEKSDFWLGLGKAITSETMTVFYLILFMIWTEMFPAYMASTKVVFVLFACAFVRMVLCLFPQNNWFHPEGSLRWSLYRNIPFTVVGAIMMVLFYQTGMTHMTWAILLSFGCYLPVTMLASKMPPIGALMMPKTLAYVWMIAMGLKLL